MSNTLNIFAGGRRPGLKAMLVGALVLLMSIPLFFVAMIADERQERSAEVQEQVGYEWGGQSQTIAGPFLIVPINHRVTQRRGEEFTTITERRHAVFLPEELDFNIEAVSSELSRGIYGVPVYTAHVAITGAFGAPDFEGFAGPQDQILWNEAFVALSVSDTRGIRSAMRLTLGDGDVPFEPGAGLAFYGASGVHAMVPTGADFSTAQTFALSVELNGASHLRLIPAGQDTTASITSDWDAPSFRGAFLPTVRDVTDDGFRASWSVPNLARGSEDRFLILDAPGVQVPGDILQASFGVDFIVPVDFYQKTFRALRYAIIFIGFSFLAFFLIELVLKTKLHAVQYLMMGAAQSLFYLLLLSAAEHIGFGFAYLGAAGATIALITIYGAAIAHSRIAGLALLLSQTIIYLLLYGLLQVEDYALLFGSIAAFAALAVTMLLTRNINWYGEGPKAEAA